MNRVWSVLSVLVLVGGGCRWPETPELPEVDECAGLEPLALSAEPRRVRVGGVISLRASGGSGQYRLRASAGGSGGEVRGERFIAGRTPATDTLAVEDVRCPALAQVEVQVVAAFAVAPARATVRPGTSFQVEVAGMVGTPLFSLEQGGSGGTLTQAGVYTAGAGEGVDLVRVRDGASGDEALLQYQVRAGARLRGAPERLALPAGGSVALRTAGGSDRVRWSRLSGPGSVEGERFVSTSGERGAALLEAVDGFTGDTARVQVLLLEELARGSEASGRLTDVATVVAADFDGDGVEDVAVGRRESDLSRPQGGAVFVFKGSPQGLPAEPTWVLTGESDTAQLGDVMAAGDLDGDGRADLAVASPGADVTIGDSGAVDLYRFGAQGPERLRQTLTGLGRGSFGAGLAIADMDGDGDEDLVVGSPLGDLAPTQQLSRRGVVDIFLLTRDKPVPDLPAVRLGGSDLSLDGTLAARTGVELGRGLVAADLNADGRVDLAALGRVSRYRADGTSQGVVQTAVAVYLARAEGARFRATPDAYVLPSNPSDSNEGTWRIGHIPASGALPPLLLLAADQADSPDLRPSGGGGPIGDAGGVLLFDLSALKPAGEPAAQPQQVRLEQAFARLYGDAGGMRAGRSWAVADVNTGLAGPELVLGAPSANAPVTGGPTLSRAGRLLVYGLGSLAQGTVLNRPVESYNGLAQAELYGVGLAGWRLPGTEGLVVVAGRASAPGLNFTGRVDAYAKAGTSFRDWSRTSVMMPARPAVERFGEVVALGHSPAGSGVVAAVGAPGWAGPGPSADGNDRDAGRTWVYTPGSASAGVVALEGASSPLWRGRSVGTDVAFTDFDGDGRQDLVVGTPSFTMPGASSRNAEVAPVFAQERAGCIPSSNLGGAGGVLVAQGRADGSFVPAWRLWAPGDIEGCTPAGNASCQRRSLGREVTGGFDFNGDGRQDIGTLRNNGFELFLGRGLDDATLSKKTMGCDPVYTAPWRSEQTSSASALGDLDGDGCDEVAWRYAGGSRSGVVVLFGHDASGARCGGRQQPAWVRLAADNEGGTNLLTLQATPVMAGRVLGGVKSYLAVGARNMPSPSGSQPAVLLFDTAELVARRPASGEALVGALGDGITPEVLFHPANAAGFGAALAGGADVTGDGVPDLVVGAPQATEASDGGGAVYVYAGGAGLPGTPAPWLVVVGDRAERSGLGQDVALLPGSGAQAPTLAIGAPLSYRTGTQNGTAYTLSLAP